MVFRTITSGVLACSRRTTKLQTCRGTSSSLSGRLRLGFVHSQRQAIPVDTTPIRRGCWRKTKMALSSFSSRVNPTTGAAEWVVEDEGYDFHQEIARSAYTDMLHDDERNKKYYEGIRRAVSIIRGRGQEVRVLDIGTGTGLLAMMAASCGADSVFACEAFPPIAAAAKKIVAENGFADKITVISKRSTEVTVGPDGDMPFRANILATEVFDTELIGEGAIPTYLHAHENLLTDDCICVPHSATVRAQVVQSDLLWRWHKLQTVKLPGCPDDLVPHPEMDTCSGAASVHDIQLSQLRPGKDFKGITEPLAMIDFNFTKGDFEENRTSSVSCQSMMSGQCQGIFMWWDLSMDTQGEVQLSTAPSWCHVDGVNTQWRDHWMQAVYFLDKPISVHKGELLTVSMTHDEYSQWFDVKTSGAAVAAPEQPTGAKDATQEQLSGANSTAQGQVIGVKGAAQEESRPICHCGAHVVWSRPRFGMLNDRERTKKFVSAMKKILTSESVCLSISDGSMLPLIAGRLGAQQVYSCEPTALCGRVMSKLLEANQLRSKVKLLANRAQDVSPDDLDGNKIDVLIAEPFFVTSLLPWHNLYLWYAWCSLRHLLATDVKMLPSTARLMGIAIEFENLWKFHAPVKTIEGFDVRIFDDVVQKSSECADAATEPHHLWEYPGRPLTQPFEVMTFDLAEVIPSEKVIRGGDVSFRCSGTCHGIALWIEYRLDEDTVVSTGLQQGLEDPGTSLVWDMHSKQGVHFIKTNPQVEDKGNLKFEATFNPASGNLHFNFDVQSRR